MSRDPHLWQHRAALRALFATYDEATLASWTNALSSWTWPPTMPVPAPPGYEVASQPEKRRLTQVVWDCLHERVSDAAVSRDWWVHHLGRTEAAWETWWAQQQADPESFYCHSRHVLHTVREARHDS